MKKIKIIDVIVWKLMCYEDYKDGFVSEYEIDFLIDPSFEIVVSEKTYIIDRIKMESDWGNHTVLALGTNVKSFHELKLDKILLNKVLDVLDGLQSKGNKLEGWEFREDIIEILNE